MPKKKAKTAKASAKKKAAAKRSRKSASTRGPLFTLLRLKGVHLSELSSSRELQPEFLPDQTKIQFSTSIHLGNHIEPTVLMVECVIRVVASNSNNLDSNVSFQSTHKLYYQSPFKIPTKLTDQESGSISALATFAIWPYTRELVSSITARMGLPSMLLPTLRGDVGQGIVTIEEPE